MIVFLDTRNQVDGFIEKPLRAHGVGIYRTKLPYGDIARADSLMRAIDIKASGGGILELARNICSKDHNRLRREIDLCRFVTAGKGELIFLIVTDEAKSIEDIEQWQSPCRKSGPYKGQPFTKVKGETLAKALYTMSEPDRYGCKVRFEFTTKAKAWQKVLKLLNIATV